MGLVDAFSAEDRVSVKFSDFYRMAKKAAESEVMANGIFGRVPHEYIEIMLTGKKAESEDPEDESDQD